MRTHIKIRAIVDRDLSLQRGRLLYGLQDRTFHQHQFCHIDWELLSLLATRYSGNCGTLDLSNLPGLQQPAIAGLSPKNVLRIMHSWYARHCQAKALILERFTQHPAKEPIRIWDEKNILWFSATILIPEVNIRRFSREGKILCKDGMVLSEEKHLEIYEWMTLVQHHEKAYLAYWVCKDIWGVLAYRTEQDQIIITSHNNDVLEHNLVRGLPL